MGTHLLLNQLHLLVVAPASTLTPIAINIKRQEVFLSIAIRQCSRFPFPIWRKAGTRPCFGSRRHEERV